MPEIQQQPDWSAQLALTVAQQVLRLRKARGLSAQALADRTAELGHEVKRSRIADMERGARPALPLTDWLVLAAALDVPPPALLFPPSEPQVAVLPSAVVNPWDAADYLGGRRPIASNPWHTSAHPTAPEWELAWARQDWESSEREMNAALFEIDVTSRAGQPVPESQRGWARTARAAMESAAAEITSLGGVLPSDTAEWKQA